MCAAVWLDSEENTVLLVGARHWDFLMRHQRARADHLFDSRPSEEQGFIDQHGAFMTRTEAWKVAEAAGQILNRCGGDDKNGGTLYSENLY